MQIFEFGKVKSRLCGKMFGEHCSHYCQGETQGFQREVFKNWLKENALNYFEGVYRKACVFTH